VATLSMTATPEPEAWPPRVRIDVVDEGNAPAISSVTVTRTIGRETVAVRSNDGRPLKLAPAGLGRAGVIYDPELPFGEVATYSTLQQPASVSDAVTVDSDVPWLVNPGIPALSRPIVLRAGSFRSRKRPVRSGVFYAQNRDTAIVVTDGRRKKPESTFIVSTETDEEFEAIEALIDDAGTLLLNVPKHLGLKIETAYINVLDIDEDRPSDVGEDILRDWVMPYVQVARPIGGTPSAWTWSDVKARYATWRELREANRTWADLRDPLS
jgi:hypothetical protein